MFRSFDRLRVVRRVALAMLLATIAGCAVNDDFTDQAERLDASIETVRNRVILTNVARASRQVPLNFTTINNVHASNQVTGALGLPALTFGPHQAAINHLYTFGGGSGSGSPNAVTAAGITSFDVNILDSKDFYRGLLLPISPRTTEAFVAQGLPREIVFYLFTDRIIAGRPGDLHKTVIRNDPGDPSFPIFQRYMDRAVQNGLSFEPLSTARAHTLPAAGAGTPAAPAPQPELALCFDPRFAAPGVDLSHATPLCGRGGRSPAVAEGAGRGAVISTPDGPREVEIVARSTFDVFQYLGKSVALGERGLVHLSSADALAPGPQHDDVLFRVEHATGAGCFISVDYAGEPYCVPRQGAPNTTRIIGLLSQLVALSTSVSDLALTQTVRIAP